MAVIVIDASDWTQRVRLQCPRGHSHWRVTRTGFYCRTCGTDGAGGAYEQFVDAKTNQLVSRDAVVITNGR